MAEQRVGKYRILERIGRGGMGMIFKAHDPSLDRLVAVKVISTEVEVTDELRTRFIREAQACAKLKHPNIVDVYDMGEHDGRLFIVMELLEGQELRRLIAPGTSLTLEDKLAVMVQACVGLHYAHQNGIVHRDIKPGNIFLLRNGQVKILDFGLARMVATDGLTRTGLIMGTLRYISPEQLQGFADHRSDMFSLGSVFYELLALRPPFTVDNPMQLLEQLRTVDPPALSELDASIPPALTRIVQRAMRKNPADRFRDLDEMRGEIEEVQREINEEWQRVSTRVRGQRQRLAQLQAQAAERLVKPSHDTEIPGIDQRRGLVAVQALERELGDRVAALESQIAQAEAAAPALERAERLMKAERYAEAVEQLEAIVAQVPDLRRAREALERSRAEADAQRLRRRATELIGKARAALQERRYAQCLEIVKEASELAVPTELARELGSLRERALAEQEALRRQWQEAEEAAQRSAAARVSAEAEEAPQYAPKKWNEAQALSGAAEASLRRGAYAEAKDGFERAAASYAGALDAARQAQEEERRTADGAREAATLAQQQARMAGAEQYASEVWGAGESKFAEAQAAFAKRALGRGAVAFREASGLYRQAEEIARNTRERDRHRAEAARERAAEGRRSAAALDAERRAPTVWQEAVRRATVGEAAWLRNEYAKATEAFEAALGLYHQAQSQIREAERRRREESARKQQEAAAGRRAAEAVEAAVDAATEWAAAEESVAAGEAALGSGAWDEASAAFDRAVESYHEAEARAREVRQARRDSQRALDASAVERSAAAAADASKYAPEPWKAAESVEARAVAAFSRQRYASAGALFGESERLYAEARSAALVAAEAEAKTRAAASEPKIPTSPVVGALDETIVYNRGATPPPVEAPIGRPEPVPPSLERADAETRILDRVTPAVDTRVLTPTDGGAGGSFDSAGAGLPVPPSAAKRWKLRIALIGSMVIGRWRIALTGSVVIVAIALVAVIWRERPVSPTLSPQPPRATESAVIPPRAARDEAIKAGAETLAPTRLALGGQKEAAGAAALKQGDTETAKQRYREALDAYDLAKREAIAMAAKAEEARQAERRATDARQAAERAGAPKVAASAWDKATKVQGRAEAAFRQQAFGQAMTLFAEATQAYDDATLDASKPSLPPPVASASAPNERQGAEDAARAAAAARREAEAAKAPLLAPQLFAAAQRKEAEGEAALKAQHLASAKQRLIESQDGFKRATQEATLEAKRQEEATLEAKRREDAAALEAKRREEATARDRQKAEEARGQTLAARRQADQLGASQYATASKLFTSAQAKEREAGNAFSRPDHAAAIRLFGEARGEYEAAGLEANKQRELADAEVAKAELAKKVAAEDAQRRRLVALKAASDEWKAKAGGQRAQAVKGEADRLAKDVFDGAELKLAEAERHVRGQSFEAASRSYQDAAGRYTEAGVQAQRVRETRTEADKAKERMLAEKQHANHAVPEFRAALEDERQGNSLYERLAFKDAAAKFNSAEMLFAKSATKAAPAPGPVPEGAKKSPGKGRVPAPPSPTF